MVSYFSKKWTWRDHEDAIPRAEMQVAEWNEESVLQRQVAEM